MNQPELGLKIAELRKAIGITQEELALNCNINVRTIQRIETVIVTPRSFTLNQIFSYHCIASICTYPHWRPVEVERRL
ncbi:MAG: helix-turn-helix transcriptional regulator [Bacteroidales bacterium]